MTTARLSGARRTRISGAMRTLLTILALSILAVPALAQPKPAKPPARPAAAPTNAPKSIGKFDDWEAATHVEAGQNVCYAFTYAKSSIPPAMPGRGKVVLTVTERQSGRDAVAISAGYTYAANASVGVSVDQAALDDFYTAQRSAFARDGHAAVVAFERARQMVAAGPGPQSTKVTDTFSLKGFTAAYV